jgi:hypothetical protein
MDAFCASPVVIVIVDVYIFPLRVYDLLSGVLLIVNDDVSDDGERS